MVIFMPIYLDTFIFMDLLSGSKEIAEKAAVYMKEEAVVSAVLLTELSFHIGRRKKSKIDEVLFYLQSLPDLRIVPVSAEIASLAGKLRAAYFKKIEKKLTYFDCLHLATALVSGCTKFVTGDRGFAAIQEIEMEIY